MCCLALCQQRVAFFNPFPTVVAIHRPVATMDRRNSPGAECGKDSFSALQRQGCTAGRGITAVEKRMQEELLRAAFRGQSHRREQLFLMAVNAAGDKRPITWTALFSATARSMAPKYALLPANLPLAIA